MGYEENPNEDTTYNTKLNACQAFAVSIVITYYLPRALLLAYSPSSIERSLDRHAWA